MNRRDSELTPVLEAVEIRSYSSFRWLGRRIDASPPLAGTTILDRRHYLHNQLTRQLYVDFYQPGSVQPASPVDIDVSTDDPVSRRFLQSLRAAHCLPETVSWGWEISGDGTARRGDLTLRVEPEDILDRGDGASGLRLRAERLGQSPGHYTIFGPVGLASDARAVRLYWNLASAGAVPLINSLTEALTAAGVPFQFKTLLNPLDYHRADAAVLYLHANDLNVVIPRLRRTHRQISPYLRENVPALTKQIGYGVGLAEDPPGGQSFGIDRCTAIAEGLIAAWEHGARDTDGRLTWLVHVFEMHGIDIAKPYLNPGSVDVYEPFLAGPSRPHSHTIDRDVSPDEALAAAREVGTVLTRQANWHGDRCNWFGQAQPGGDFAPLGPDLYGGTSGIALFLADLHQATGDRCHLDTALGAVRQALRTLDQLDDDVLLGLYTGIPGIALAALYIGRLAGDHQIERAGGQLLDSLDLSRPTGWDLLSGAAGTALALLTAHRINPIGDQLLEAASQIGAALLVAGQTDVEDHLAWPVDARISVRPLTGFAHGAAGIGHALLELGLATREQRFMEGAWKAFSYERSWYDQASRNWPDFRYVESKAARPRGPLPTMAGWCHGAPGIALSRLRAYQMSGDLELLHEIQAATDTTARAIENGLATGRASSSLCHGLVGNAEILSLVSEVVPLTGATRRLIDRVARHEIEQQRSACTLEATTSPGLMLGLAGRGRFLLRLARPELPSILLPRPEDFDAQFRPESEARILSAAHEQRAAATNE